jgi:hypothetical protein
MSPFVIAFYGSILIGKLFRRAVSNRELDDEDSECSD